MLGGDPHQPRDLLLVLLNAVYNLVQVELFPQLHVFIQGPDLRLGFGGPALQVDQLLLDCFHVNAEIVELG